MYYIYLLKSLKYSKTYTGITDNLLRRLKEHNQGLHSYTKRYMPWSILYYEKQHDRIDARKREKYLKSAVGRKWVKNNLFID